MKRNFTFVTSSLLSLAIGAVSCSENSNDGRESGINEKIVLENRSVNPSLVFAMPGFEDLDIFTLISSDDVLPESPNFIFGAQPDGAGLLKDPAGDGYILINNHEIHRSVSRVYLDETFKPVKGEYILDYEGGQWRTCSATLATPEEHGFGPIFLTAGESGQESLVHAIDPIGAANKSNKDRVKKALGRASMENAVPLPKDAYTGKTVILIGEDQSYGASHQSAGQLVMYVSNTVGDLDNGTLYALKRTNDDFTETNMVKGQDYDVTFAVIPNDEQTTGSEINTANIARKTIRFSRVEDLDYRKGGGANSREIYFTATGQSPDGTNPEPGYTMWGRVYRLKMDANNPLTGKLSLVMEGDSNPGVGIINPDNVCVTENYVYTQEDGDSFYPQATHDSYIWQYSIATGTNKPWLNMNHRRTDTEFSAKYNPSANTKLGSWEFGAMYDVSDIIGVPESFLVNIHPHTWQEDKFLKPDGSTLNTSNNKEGGQVVLIRGVQK